jgi:hypothetical protein
VFGPFFTPDYFPSDYFPGSGGSSVSVATTYGDTALYPDIYQGSFSMADDLRLKRIIAQDDELVALRLL